VDDVLKAERNGVGQPERNEALAILYSTKGEIIRV
jgi:hemoglobin